MNFDQIQKGAFVVIKGRPCEITECQVLNPGYKHIRKKGVTGIDLVTGESITSRITNRCKPQTFYLRKKNIFLEEIIENEESESCETFSKFLESEFSSEEIQKIQNSKEEIRSIRKILDDEGFLDCVLIEFELPHEKNYKIEF